MQASLRLILPRLIPLRIRASFQEARWLLEFVLPSFTKEGTRGDGLDEQVCRNVLESLSEIARNAKHKALDEGYERAHKDANWAMDFAMNDVNKGIRNRGGTPR
jgi:hypothetical protein